METFDGGSRDFLREGFGNTVQVSENASACLQPDPIGIKYSRVQSGRLGRRDTFGRGDTCRSAHLQFHWFITRQILLV